MASGPSPALTAAQRAKGYAWDKQSGALAAQEYRLTLTSRRDGLPTYNIGKGKGEGGSERFYKPDEVRSLIPYLSRQNLLGYDIYVTPIDGAQHFILIDDATPEGIEEMNEEGFCPALVQQSSEGNLQAVLRTPRENQPQEQKAANGLLVRLNRQWGDPNISSVRRPFRMAGFSNKKPGRGDYFTRVIEAAGVVCGKTTDLLAVAREKLREAMSKPTPRAEQATKVEAAPEILPAPEGPADARFDALRLRELALVEMKGWTRNDSALDYRVAVAMIEEDYGTDEIAGAMRRRSPNIETRHPDFSTYISRTIVAAGRPEGRPNDTHDEDGPTGPS